MSNPSELKIKPTRFRFLLLSIFLIGTILIWGGYFTSIYVIQDNARNTLSDKAQTLALIFEDQVSISMDAIAARLKSVAAFTTPESLRDGRLSRQSLARLIADDYLIRSLSLVDDQGVIVASSSTQTIGAILSNDILPADSLATTLAVVQFGQVYPYRDLNEIDHGPASHSVSVWVASFPVQLDGRHYHWVAGLNTGLFLNLWARVSQDPAISIALLNYQETAIATQNIVWSDNKGLQSELNFYAGQADRGNFRINHDGESFVVAYRASKSQPVILTVVGNIGKSFEALSGQRHYFLLAAMSGFLILVFVFAILTRGYLLYEQSVIEMTNQTMAISAHLMVSESLPSGEIMNVNDAFEKVSGYSKRELVGKHHNIFNSKLQPSSFYKELWTTILAGHIWKGVLRNVDRTGRYFWVNATIMPFTNAWGKITRYVAFYSDITQAMSLAEQLEKEKSLRQALTVINKQLVSDVNTDMLTKIPNRRAFDIFAQEALKSARKVNQTVSLLMIDIDKFKLINDTYGHAAGDIVLQELAHRWSSNIRGSDMLARLGGEEFCLLLPQASEVDAKLIAKKMLKLTSQTPIQVTGFAEMTSIYVNVSIGLVTAAPDNALSIQTLLGLADEALYQAKDLGGNCIVISEPVHHPTINA